MKKVTLGLSMAALALGLVFTTGCKDACEKDDPCINGTCADVDGEATCTCDAGYEGTTCSDEQRDKFEGSYTFTDSCDPGQSNTSTVSEASNVSQVLMTNILGDALGGTAVADVSGTTISIASQTVTDVDGDTWTVESTSSGTISNGQFTMTTVSTFGGNSITCQLSYQQQ